MKSVHKMKTTRFKSYILTILHNYFPEMRIDKFLSEISQLELLTLLTVGLKMNRLEFFTHSWNNVCYYDYKTSIIVPYGLLQGSFQKKPFNLRQQTSAVQHLGILFLFNTQLLLAMFPPRLNLTHPIQSICRLEYNWQIILETPASLSKRNGSFRSCFCGYIYKRDTAAVVFILIKKIQEL